jgi:enoyl-CoA hydratase/carnithine racemase
MSDTKADPDSTVVVERQDKVGVITLNRPSALNALTIEMQARYVDSLRMLDTDPDIRVIVVTGAGRGFCAGGDLALLRSGNLPSYAPTPDELPTVALSIRKPIVAAVNGAVAGIGFAVMMSCDVRFISENVRVGTSFSRLGLVAEYGLSWLLPRIIGTGAALELLFSGRTVKSDEALKLGLVQEVVSDRPVLNRALEWACEVADQCSPRSLATIKRQVYGDLTHTWNESVMMSIELMRKSFAWGDIDKALAAMGTEHAPKFDPLRARD